MNKPWFYKGAMLLISSLLVGSIAFANNGKSWEQQVSEIEKNIKAPLFNDKEYNIIHFGAEKGGVTDCRKAINDAITKCSEEGGGSVIVPEGNYYVKGSILFKSNVNLHLKENSKLIFSSDEKDYLPAVLTRWEGSEVFNFSPLIYAYNVSNIAITGKGVLDGQGSKNIAKWKPNQKPDQQEIRRMGREGVPVYERVFGEGHWLRPAFIEMIACKNILLEDVKIVDATFWIIHPIGCDNVTVRGVEIDSFNENSDGFDPESTTNALIENCYFRTGDDGVAIKSGRDQDGWRFGQPTENVIIRNSTFESIANGVCVGSEISGGVRNVFIDNITVPNAKQGVYFKSNLDRGGYIENVWVRNVKIDSVRTAIKFEPDYKSESKGDFPTRYKNFFIENVECNYASITGVEVVGFEKMPIENVSLRNIVVKNASKSHIINHVKNIDLRNVVINGQYVNHKLTNKTISLNGSWDVAISDSKPKNFSSKVPVPGVLTMSEPLVAEGLDGNDLKDDVGYDYVWYRLNFDLDEQDYSSAVLKLRAKYNARVYLNGKEIGYDHHCTYSHGEFNISDAVNLNGSNELLVKVGSWNTASSPSKENNSEWWRNSRAPGLWDEVYIELGGDVRVSHVKVIPDIKKEISLCDVTLINNSDSDDTFTVTASVFDGARIVSEATRKFEVKKDESKVCGLKLPSDMLEYWSAGKEGHPKLYTMRVDVKNNEGVELANNSVVYGYRNIETKGKDVLLNGEKIMFRAENIAFVRALNRWSHVMFDEVWIRKFLRTIIQEYNLNYLRFHLGHAYSKWYEIANEEGIMLQDEWIYMHDDDPVGQDLVEAEIEFWRWIKQNVNHPSIVTWDQENEGHVRLEALKAAISEYDPTRLWGEDDFNAHHIYDYSEQVIPAPHFDAPADKPSTVLESCRLWTNEYGLLEPREDYKTSRTATGWGIYYFDKEIIGQLLADLHADIGTYFRSNRIQAWAPFALLSGWVNGQNFFLGDIGQSLTPQPSLLNSLKRVNEPIGVSIDMLQCREWYKEKTIYRPNTKFSKDLLAWNDFATDVNVILRMTIKDLEGSVVGSYERKDMIPAYESIRSELSFNTPRKEGCYLLEPAIVFEDGSITVGPERRIMVAKKTQKHHDEFMAFGGMRTPLENGESVFRNFLGEDAPELVERMIIKSTERGLLDRLSVSNEQVYTLQTTEYEGINTFKITTTEIDRNGKVISTQEANARNFVDLPDAIKQTIVKNIGVVPVDESRITIREYDGYTRYDIRLIESSVRYRLEIEDNGTLRSKKEM